VVVARLKREPIWFVCLGCGGDAKGSHYCYSCGERLKSHPGNRGDWHIFDAGLRLVCVAQNRTEVHEFIDAAFERIGEGSYSYYIIDADGSHKYVGSRSRLGPLR
jgi:hypothetical protein